MLLLHCAALPRPISTIEQMIVNQNRPAIRAIAITIPTVGSSLRVTGTAALLMLRGAGDNSQLDAWEHYVVSSLRPSRRTCSSAIHSRKPLKSLSSICYAVQPDVVPFDVLNHVHNVEKRVFCCPQTFLTLDFQFRDDVSELKIDFAVEQIRGCDACRPAELIAKC